MIAMRLLLLKPPSNFHLIALPMGIGYVASYLKNKMGQDIDILFLDCLRDKYDHNKFSDYVKEVKPDMIGITANSMEINSALKCCNITKIINRRIITVIGGPHATVLPEEVLSNKDVDFIFRGEADLSFYEFIKSLQNRSAFSGIPGLGYKSKGKMEFNPVEMPQNLDELPMMDLNLMQFKRYPKTYKMKYYPSAPILTSRGCPFPCTYCSARRISGEKFRSRSPENIVREIKQIKSQYNVREFEVWDDNFTLNNKRAHEFCDLLIQEKINLPWWCPNGLRLETLDETLLKKMSMAGLYSIGLGIESGSPRTQRNMRKNLDFDKLKKIVKLGNKYGIRMEGFFILGYPTETEEDILQTIGLAKELPLKRAAIFLFQPIPGSEIYDALKKDGKIHDMNYGGILYSNPSFLPEGIQSLKRLKGLQQKAYLEFYLRPRIFFDFMRENFTFQQLKEVWDMIKTYIFNRNPT